MRILILGGAGMLGHQLWRQLRNEHEVFVTVRQAWSLYEELGLFDRKRTLCGIDALDVEGLLGVVSAVKPEVVINGVGIIKQLKEARDPVPCIAVNALLPHRLAGLCGACGIRLIHMSTDCVFSGRKGMYTEQDMPDAEDLYGRTKLLGEVDRSNCLTLRTSIIGRELRTRSGLIEWFLAQKGGVVKGFRKAIYTGFTTQALARIIGDVLVRHPCLSGVWQVSSEPISKYEILRLARDAFGVDIRIDPDDSFVCDRSLDSSAFRRETGFYPVSWMEMIRELAGSSREDAAKIAA